MSISYTNIDSILQILPLLAAYGYISETKALSHTCTILWTLSNTDDIICKAINTSGYRTRIMYLARFGHLQLLNSILEQCKILNINASTLNGRTAISFAAEGGHVSIIRLLLSKGANPNAQSINNRYPIIFAFERNHFNAVAALLRGNAYPYYSETTHFNALDLLLQACEVGHAGIIRILLQKKFVSLQQVLLKSGQNALMIASRKGYTRSVTILISFIKKIDSHANMLLNLHVPSTGETALHFASQNGHTKIVKKLLKAGADPNVRDNLGHTPLCLAALKGKYTVGRILLKNGASYTLRPATGTYPLISASISGSLLLVKELVFAGADVNSIPAYRGSRSALQEAAAHGHKNIIAFLLKHGAQITTTYGDAEYPLTLAAEKGHYTCLSLLVSHLKKYFDIQEIKKISLQKKQNLKKMKKVVSIDTNGINSNDILPLHVAATGTTLQHSKCLLLLLSLFDFDINAQGLNGRTPLCLAAANGAIQNVNILLNAGANINIHDIFGSTPLTLSAIAGFKDIVQILLDNDDIDIPKELIKKKVIERPINAHPNWRPPKILPTPPSPYEEFEIAMNISPKECADLLKEAYECRCVDY